MKFRFPSTRSANLRLAALNRLGNGWIIAGLCVIFAVINVQHFFKIRDSERPSSQTAFLRWTPQVRDLDNGVDIWHKYNWPNTPIMAMILKPLMNVEPPFVGSQIWLFLKMACAIASITLVFLMLDRPAHPFPFWGKALTVLLALRPIEGDLVHGNVNLFILFTVVLGVYAFSRGWDITAGLSLALGIACKVTPALFLPYLAWKRAWKTLAATMIGLTLWLLFVPSLYLGWNRNLECLTSWFNGMVKPFIVKNAITSEHQNQSLPGFLERMFRDRPSITGPKENYTRYDAMAYHNLTNLSPVALSIGIKLCMAAFCFLAMWRFRAPQNDRTDWRWMAEFGAVVLGMLIFSERTWKHHAVTLLIPFAVIAHQLSAFRLPRGMKWYLGCTLAAVVVLMLLTTSGLIVIFGVPDRQDVFGKYAQIYGAYLWSFILLAGAAFLLAGQKRNDPVRPYPLTAETEFEPSRSVPATA